MSDPHTRSGEFPTRSVAWWPPVALTVIASTVIRLGFALGVGYGVDEAYAVAVARPWSWSYFDHPPLHFWMAGVMSDVTGTTAPWVVRLPFIAAFTVTLLAVAGLTRRLFGERAARVATLLGSASGVLGVTSGTWVLPDGPLLMASALAALVMAPLFVAPAPPGRERAQRWLAGGALLGTALLAKYHAGLFVAAVGGLALTRREIRADLRTPWPWLALGLALVGLVPTLLWNAQHDWVSFRFQGARATVAHWSPVPLLTLIGGQVAWLLPWVALPLAAATARAMATVVTARRARSSAASQSALAYCLTWMAGPVAVFTTVSAGGAPTLPHWMAPGWLFALPLAGWWMTQASTDRPWRDRLLRAAPLATASLVALVVGHARTRMLDRWLPPSVRASEPTRDAVSWAPALPSDPSTVLLVRSWIQGGQLGAASARPRPIVCLCADPHHFALRGPPGRTWTRGLLIERAQPWKRGWQPAPVALAGDSLRFVLRDSLRLDPAVWIVRYDVTRVPDVLHRHVESVASGPSPMNHQPATPDRPRVRPTRSRASPARRHPAPS